MFITWRQKSGRHFILQCVFLKKLNSNTKNVAYTSLVRPILEYREGCVLGSVQGGADKCVRPGAKESGKICKSYERFELGSVGAAYKDSTHMCSLQSVLRRTGLEGYR